LHREDISRSTAGIERKLSGRNEVALEDDLLAIPTPGHTRGHSVLLYRNRYLFSGDHVWWSPNYKSLHASAGVCWYSWPEQTRSMERLLDYRFEWVLPGHGRRANFSTEEMQQQLRTCVARMKRDMQAATS
jgi:glyoxylase-like metal-dependent hydrolase (beta-lactamase superfamily II)